MAVLVTGGAGYIGSHMTLALVDAGEEVVVLDDLSTGFSWAVPQGVPLVVGDFGDEDLVTETIARHNISEIAHFAAKIVVPEFGRRPARLLSQQHGQGPHAARHRRELRGRALHLLLDGGRLWRPVHRIRSMRTSR